MLKGSASIKKMGSSSAPTLTRLRHTSGGASPSGRLSSPMWNGANSTSGRLAAVIDTPGRCSTSRPSPMTPPPEQPRRSPCGRCSRTMSGRSPYWAEWWSETKTATRSAFSNSSRILEAHSPIASPSKWFSDSAVAHFMGSPLDWAMSRIEEQDCNRCGGRRPDAHALGALSPGWTSISGADNIERWHPPCLTGKIEEKNGRAHRLPQR